MSGDYLLTSILFFSLKHPVEYYPLCFWFGFVVPGALAYARSTFAEIIPIGRENEMYSLFLITQGGGGWVSVIVAIL